MKPEDHNRKHVGKNSPSSQSKAENENQQDASHAANMMNRGVTRPGDHSEQQTAELHASMHMGAHDMNQEQRMKMLHMHHAQTLWIYWLLLILGVWLVLSPLTFSYAKGTVSTGETRTLWLSLSQRIAACTWSDIISGLLLIVFSTRSLVPNRPFSLWMCCFVGIWLNMAPLLFWAPTAAIYINDTLVGVLVISLSVLIPGMPNMMAYMKMGSEVPPGWSYNPSSWVQRWSMIVLGFAGWMVSRYLGAYQLGYIDHAWDPFFGNSTKQVLNSAMSRSWPISDGAFGGFAYTLEFLMGWMGSPSRWRTMPWMVTFFGILVIPLGLVHIFLVISQPVIVGAWCFFCLLAAGIMLPMIPLEADEVIAMGQHMVQSKRRGESFWKVFWKGGTPIEHNTDQRSPELITFYNKPWNAVNASFWGMGATWTLILSTVIGIVLMFTPALFHVPITTTIAHIFHISGALMVVIAVISMGEVLRAIRFGNIVTALSAGIVPWLVYSPSLGLNITGSIAGVAIIILTIPRGHIKEKYGLWDQYVL